MGTGGFAGKASSSGSVPGRAPESLAPPEPPTPGPAAPEFQRAPEPTAAALLRGIGWALAVVATFLGALVGALYSRQVIPFAGVPLPVGWIVAIALPIAVITGVRRMLGPCGGVVGSLVWVAGVFAVLLPRGEGDIVVASDWLGYGFLILVVVGFCWTIGRSLLVRPSTSATPDRSTGGR